MDLSTPSVLVSGKVPLNRGTIVSVGPHPLTQISDSLRHDILPTPGLNVYIVHYDTALLVPALLL